MLQPASPELEARGRARAGRREACRARRSQLARFADLRYAGQAYELTLPVAAGAPTSAGSRPTSTPSTTGPTATPRRTRRSTSVNLKLTARAAGNGDAPYDPLAGLGQAADERTRRAYFGPEHGLHRRPVISRAALLDSPPRRGPLIVEEYDATCVVPPDCRATLDALGNIDIALESAMTA